MEDEANVSILSDRRRDEGIPRPIPALLAVAGLHHYLIREAASGTRVLARQSSPVTRGEVHDFSASHRRRRLRDQPLRGVRVDRRPHFKKVLRPASTTRRPA